MRKHNFTERDLNILNFESSAVERRDDSCCLQPAELLYLLSEQLVINSEAIQSVDVLPQLQVALSELLDVLARFRQDSSFALKQR